MSISINEMSNLTLKAANESDNYSGSIIQEVNNILNIFNQIATNGPSIDQTERAKNFMKTCREQYPIAQYNAKVARDCCGIFNNNNINTNLAQQHYNIAQTARYHALTAYNTAMEARKNVEKLQKEVLLKPAFENLDKILKSFNEMAALSPTKEESAKAYQQELSCRTFIWKVLNGNLPYYDACLNSENCLINVKSMQQEMINRKKKEVSDNKAEKKKRKKIKRAKRRAKIIQVGAAILFGYSFHKDFKKDIEKNKQREREDREDDLAFELWNIKP